MDEPEKARPTRGRPRNVALLILALGAVALGVALTTGGGMNPDEVVEVAARSLQVPIVDGFDDASETLSTGLVELETADLELGRDVEEQLVGLRFRDIAIPPGSTITSATIQFASARYTDDATRLTFTGEAVDDAEVFSRVARDISARQMTQAAVEWTPEPWFGVGELGTDQRSPELAAIVDEIVGRPGWQSGNALVIFVHGSGKRSAESFDGPLSLPPVLRLRWQAPTADNASPLVDAGADQRVNVGQPLAIDAEATDDQQEALVTTWSTLDGPAMAQFTDEAAVDTVVTFETAGTYVLRLVADDGEIARQDTVTVEVVDPDALPPPIRFAVIGDYGQPGPGEAVVAALVQSLAPDFVVTVGDNAYVADIDDAIGAYYVDFIGDYRGAFGQGSSRNRFFPALGNHEETDLAGGLASYEAYFDLPGAGIDSSGTSGNERYYDFVQGPVHFFVVNSNATEPDGRGATSVQAQWLERGLAASTAPWQIVVAHHPPYSSANGAGATPVLRWPFEAWGADAVLSGHAHVYERLWVDGLVYFVNGIGGEGAASLAPDPLPEDRARYNGGLGAMIVEACAARLEFSLHTVAEGVVDTFALGATDCSGTTPIDQLPHAYAGRDETFELGGSLSLAGVVDDDGSVSAGWSQVSGPGVATFADPGQAATTVTFSRPGPYVLALEASDRAQSVVDEVEIIVTDATYRSLDVALSASSDDAEQRLGSGLVQLESTDLGLGVGSQPQLVGLRFQGVAVPPGAVIERAYIQFEVDEIDRASAALSIAGELAADAATFAATQLNVSGRPPTAATVSWFPPEWPAERAAGPAQRTADLTPIVQEIIDQAGWASGNAMAFVISGSGTRTAESADGNPGSAPVLHVEYRFPAG